MIPLLYWLNQEVPLGACDQPFSCTSMMFLVLLQTTERKLLLYWPPCSPTLPNILRKLADGVLSFVYFAHSSMSTRYDQSILSTIGQNGEAFVYSRHSREKEGVCEPNIQTVFCK